MNEKIPNFDDFGIEIADAREEVPRVAWVNSVVVGAAAGMSGDGQMSDSGYVLTLALECEALVGPEEHTVVRLINRPGSFLPELLRTTLGAMLPKKEAYAIYQIIQDQAEKAEAEDRMPLLAQRMTDAGLLPGD